MATSATPEEIRQLFGRRRTLAIGVAFGVITVLGPRAAGQIDVATFRSDATYSDGRRPDRVTFTNAREDASRRDFTINGLFYDPMADQVIDYVGGREDLLGRKIRAIGDPARRIEEDLLRMLRAVRFAATLDFEIEPATLSAIHAAAGEVTTVSPERIGMELRRMLVDRRRTAALDLLRSTRLLPQVLPEVDCLPRADWQATRGALAALEGPTLALALAALLLRCGPRPAVAARIGRRLRYSNQEVDRAGWLLASLAIVEQARSVPWPGVQRRLAHAGGAELVELLAATVGDDDAAVLFCRERLAWPREQLDPPPLLDGSDLIAHGLKPGPRFSRLLEEVRDAQLVGAIASRADALSLVDRRLAAGGGAS